MLCEKQVAHMCGGKLLKSSEVNTTKKVVQLIREKPEKHLKIFHGNWESVEREWVVFILDNTSASINFMTMKQFSMSKHHFANNKQKN